MKYDVIVTAAGMSTRFNACGNKQFYMLDGKTLIERTVECFLPMIEGSIIVVARRDERQIFENILGNKDYEFRYADGGSQRAHSVLNGLRQASSEYVMVHDGARPFVNTELITRLIDSYKENSIVIPAVQPHDTVRYENGSLKLLDRKRVYLIQTPQLAERKQLIRAMENALDKGHCYTDEAQYMHEAGHGVIIVNGDRKNIKITTDADIIAAQSIIRGDV